MIIALLALGLGTAYAPWMAAFTETIEKRNPALTATGLAIWGWILRIVVCVSFFVLPYVVSAMDKLTEAPAVLARSRRPARNPPPALLAEARQDQDGGGRRAGSVADVVVDLHRGRDPVPRADAAAHRPLEPEGGQGRRRGARP